MMRACEGRSNLVERRLVDGRIPVVARAVGKRTSLARDRSTAGALGQKERDGLRPAPEGRGAPEGRVLWEGADRAQAVAFSPDGTLLAVGTGVLNGSDGVAVLDVATGDVVTSLPGHRNHVLGLAFSPDGRTLTSASYEAVKRWGQTIDMVGPVLMLASDAGAYVTGNVILADGGILCRTFD